MVNEKQILMQNKMFFFNQLAKKSKKYQIYLLTNSSMRLIQGGVDREVGGYRRKWIGNKRIRRQYCVTKRNIIKSEVFEKGT